MIDLHSHILPNLDHGTSSVETSLEQLRLAAKFGVSRVVATSHFYPQRENVDRFLARRRKSLEKLIPNLTSDLPEIRIGAEVLICDNIEEMPLLNKLCIGGSNVLLLELPFTDFSNGYVESVRELVAMGYDIVLAHADRYNPRDIERLIAVGAKIQLNADSLCHLLVKKHIRDWITRDLVVAIGSDIHGSDARAYKRFASAYKKLKSKREYISECSYKMWQKFKKEY